MPPDVVDRLERVARRHVVGALPPDRSGELAAAELADLLLTYGNWRGRFIPRRRRAVHLARELQAELASAPNWQGAVETVLKEIHAGEDLTPRLSDRVDVAHVPKAQRKTGGGLDLDVDAVLAHDGLHHLHLGRRTGARFVNRTKELLFVAFTEDDAFVVGVYPHGAWGRREMLERIVRNWPKAQLVPKLDGLIGVGTDVTDEERWGLMKAGVTVLVEIDGSVYVPLGQSTARTPIQVTQRVNALMWELRYIREQGAEERLRLRGGNPSLYWIAAVREEHLGLLSAQGFVAFGQLS